MKVNDVFLFEYNEDMIEKFGQQSLYWCFDGILVAKKKNNEIILIDTYWLSSQPKIMTLEEVKRKGKLKFLFNLDDVIETDRSALKYYNNEDIYILNAQHGYETKYYLKKDAKKSQSKMLETVNNEIDEAKQKIERLQQQLNILIDKKEKIEAGNLDVVL